MGNRGSITLKEPIPRHFRSFRALKRLTDFREYGTIPEDLKPHG
jgi:hypothetical protein